MSIIIKPIDFNPFTLPNSFLINLQIIFNDVIPEELIHIIFHYWEVKLNPLFLTNLLGLKTVFNDIMPRELINIIIEYWEAGIKPIHSDSLFMYSSMLNIVRIMGGFAGISYSN